ncbi:MAG: DNA polymerase III subunit gamma/tau [Verrucomicrobia bacterium]|nr:DNA polymerase III subunit gamma/tau [Verrucomicrobiota bacterium]
MSYQVIARKYRPQRFSDVVGQEHVTNTLANAVNQSRIAHAYLFCGPRGTGKTTIARIFAKALNCTDGPKAEFDDNDTRVQEITEGRALDVIEIDGASNNGVEQVRELRETCKYAPATSKFKIYIIDEVHMLSTQAFNALLKTLEEPPAHVKFLFATTDPEKVLPTILSRCQRFDLRRIPTALIVEHLGHIAKQEGVKIEDAALYAIARGAEGGMRDAESTLDQLISFCGNDIKEPDVLSMFGLTAQSQILDLTDAVLNADAERALRELNDLAKNGKDLGRLLSDLLSHFRNLLLFQVSKGDMKLLEVSEAEAAIIGKQAPVVSAETLTRIMDVLTDAESRLRDTASKKILVEVSLLKAIEARNAVSIDAVLKQLQQLRSEGGGGQSTAPATTTAQAPRPAVKAVAAAPAPAPFVLREQAPAVSKPAAPPVAAPVAVTAADGSVDLPQLWQQLMEGIARVSPFTKTYLIEAHPVSFEKNLLTIGFDSAFADHIGLVDNSRNHAIIQGKLQELGYGKCHVKFIQSEAPAHWVRLNDSDVSPAPAAAAPTPATAFAPAPKVSAPEVAKPKGAPAAAGSFDKEEFKNDPLIKAALETFRGQIVEIRS